MLGVNKALTVIWFFYAVLCNITIKILKSYNFFLVVCYNFERGLFMRIQEHYENFMSQPEIEAYVEIYDLILENKADNWQKICIRSI